MGKRVYIHIHGLSVEEFDSIELALVDVHHHSTFSSGRMVSGDTYIEFFSEGQSPHYKEKKDEQTDYLGRSSSDNTKPASSDPLPKTSWGSH